MNVVFAPPGVPDTAARAGGSATATARLLEYAPGRAVALAPHATIELLEAAPVLHVPGAPAHALGLIRWQGRRIPLLDLGVMLGALPACAEAAPAHVLVVAWQAAPREPVDFGALMAPRLLHSVAVDDTRACALPDDGAPWAAIAQACFTHEGRPVPVLDLARVFAAR